MTEDLIHKVLNGYENHSSDKIRQRSHRNVESRIISDTKYKIIIIIQLNNTKNALSKGIEGAFF